MTAMAKFIPINVQEHDNELRTIIVKHMGTGGGNPTQWVVNACHEAFQRGFGLGFDTGIKAANTRPPPPPPYRVDIPDHYGLLDAKVGDKPGDRPALPLVERSDDDEPLDDESSEEPREWWYYDEPK